MYAVEDSMLYKILGKLQSYGEEWRIVSIPLTDPDVLQFLSKDGSLAKLQDFIKDKLGFHIENVRYENGKLTLIRSQTTARRIGKKG